MRNYLLGIFCFLMASSAGAQDLMKSPSTSPYTYFYSISNSQAMRIARKGSLDKGTGLFYTKVDSFPTGSVHEGKLAPGHYLKSHIDRDRVDLEYICIPNIHLTVVDNQTDLILQVRDFSGTLLTNAELAIDSRRIPFDLRTGSYRLEKANCRGIISVTHDGITSLIRLERGVNNPAAKRVSRKIVYGTPVKYVWVPVRTAVMLPVDAVISAFRGYGFHTARSLWGGITRSLDPERPSTGYIVFNKPRYNPGDTVMLKAFILHGKNHKPFTREVDIRLIKSDPYAAVKIGTIAPYTPGGYSFSFVPADTLDLKLDKDYMVTMSPAGRHRTIISGRFRYEYYDLKGMKLNMRLPEQVHYSGKPFLVALQAVNENEMVLPDTRVTMSILRDRVSDVFSGHTLIRDTLTVLRENLLASGETFIEIPDSVFPQANLDYIIVALANTSDNETASARETVSFVRKKEEFEFDIKGDTVTFSLTVDGNGAERQGTIVTEDAFGNKAAPAHVTFPVSMMTDPFVTAYTITSGNTTRTVKADEIPPGIRCTMSVQNDTVFINAVSSTRLNFSYFIYRLNREVQRGVTDSLNFRQKARGDKEWYLSLSYLWGGKMNNSMYRVGIQKDKLNIIVEQPSIIIPGNSAGITLRVTDYEGTPVAGADLTAFSLTGKFDYELPLLPSLAPAAKQKEQINRFSISTATDPDLWYRFRFDEWDKEAGLDTIEYFRFRYHSREVYTFLSDMGDGITQFAPFIFRGGVPVKINHIYVDNKPLYIDFASENQPYSFRVDTGYHLIRIRTPRNIYEIDSLRFEPGKKLILSISDKDDPSDYDREEVKPKLTKAEAGRLRSFILPYRSAFNNNVAWLAQQGNFFLMSNVQRQLSDPYQNSPGYSYDIIGPVMPGKARFVSAGQFETSFDFEPGYEYEFRAGLLKMKSFEPEKWVPNFLSGYSPMEDFRSSVLTTTLLDSVRREILKVRSRKPYYYLRNEPTKPGNGSVEIMNLSKEAGQQPVALVLFDLPARVVHTRRGHETSFTNIKPGLYTFMVFVDDGGCLRIDSVQVTADSRTFLDLTVAIRESDQGQFNRVLELVAMTSKSDINNTGYERQLLQEFSRQDISTYNGPGFTVTGRVISDDDGEALPGVTVLCRETGTGVVTDFDGKYSIRLPFGVNLLTFGFIGMKVQEHEVSFDQTLDVRLESDFLALEEVVVVGYGMSRKQSLTTSSVTITESLQGRVAGVEIMDESVFLIRGVSSLSAETPPLILIDGIPYTGDLADLDPDLIRQAQILRDPALTSLYGSRAAGGVIMFTTGKGGVLTVTQDKGANFDDSFMEQAMAAGTLRRNFRDYAYWQPRLRTDDSGRVSFNATFPDDITSWETFVIGMTGKRQAGSATGVIKAFRPVIAQLAAPRYLVEGDSVNLIGKIINYTPAPVNLTERFILNTDTAFARERKFNDAVIDTIPVSAGLKDSLRMEFSFITAGGLKDGEYRAVPVYRAGVEIDTGTFMVLSRDTTFTIDLEAFSGEVTLTVMAGALDVLKDNSLRLIRYSYQCNEQMASKLIGLLTAEALNKLLGTEKRIDQREAARLIRQLNSNRNEKGLWGWWGKSDTEPWISLHILNALQMAKEQGYDIGSHATTYIDDAILLLESALPAQLKLSVMELLTRMKARIDYNHYLTSMVVNDTLGFTDSLRMTALKQRHNLPAEVDFLKKAHRTTIYNGIYFTSEEKRHGVCSDDIGTTLLAYKVLAADTAQKVADLSMIRQYFIETMTFGSRLNTWETANILWTVLPELGQSDDGGAEARLKLSGQVNREADTFPYDVRLRPEGSITVSKSGVLPIYMSCSEIKFITDPSPDTTDFRIKTRWPGSRNEVRAGTPVTLTVDIEFYKSAEYLVIEIPVPAGFSYSTRESMVRGEAHREFHRDHVAIFIRHTDPGRRSFTVELMPRFTGTFTANPAKVSLMYFPTIFSNEGVGKVKIY